MGFYIEMSQDSFQRRFFRESGVPTVIWILYGIAVFAVFCMGAAAFTVLKDLFQQGTYFDRILLSLILLALPVLLIFGLKLAFFRKYLDFSKDSLFYGFRVPLFEINLSKRVFPKNEITGVFLVNKRQSANLAKKSHPDQRYHIRGHWRVLVEWKGRRFVLDRGTEKESLEPLYQELSLWLEPLS